MSYCRQAETPLFPLFFFFPPLAGKMGTNARICHPGAWDSAAAPRRRHQHKKNWYQGTLLCQGFRQVLFIPVLNFPADEEHVILGDTSQSCACKLKSWAPRACWEAAHRWRTLAARCASWGHICGGFAACKGLLLHSEGKCDFPVVVLFFFFVEGFTGWDLEAFPVFANKTVSLSVERWMRNLRNVGAFSPEPLWSFSSCCLEILPRQWLFCTSPCAGNKGKVGPNGSSVCNRRKKPPKHRTRSCSCRTNRRKYQAHILHSECRTKLIPAAVRASVIALCERPQCILASCFSRHHTREADYQGSFLTLEQAKRHTTS